VSAVAAGEATGAGDGAQSTRAAGTTQAEQSDGTDPLWRQVRRALGSLRNLPTGEQQLTIRLRPDDLGSVVVRISTGDAGTTVALVAESATAANQLNQQRQQLISELQDGGLRGVSVDVGTGDDAGRSEGDEAEADVEQSGVDGTVSAAGRVNADGELLRSYRGRPGRGSSEGLIDVDL
jgi:flagellar hook-length control protein FliK